MNKFLLISIIGLFQFSIFLLSEVFAVENPPYSGISASPSSFRLTIERGGSQTVKTTLLNPTQFEQEYTFSVRDTVAGGERGGLSWVPVEEDAPGSLGAWINFDRTPLVLKSSETRQMSLTLNIPSWADPGGHYASLFVAGNPWGASEEFQDMGLRVINQLAITFYVTVPGEIKWGGELLSFEGSKFVEGGPITLEARFKNLGTVHQEPKGTIDFYDFFGRKVDTVSIGPNFIFPGSIRVLPAVWNKLFLLGPYRAELILRHGEDLKETVVAEIKFFALPWKIAVGGSLVVLFLIGLGRLTKKSG